MCGGVRKIGKRPRHQTLSWAEASASSKVRPVTAQRCLDFRQSGRAGPSPVDNGCGQQVLDDEDPSLLKTCLEGNAPGRRPDG